MIRLLEPAFLALLLPLAALVLLWGRRSLAGLSRARARLAIALRLGVVAGLVLALCEPSWTGGRGETRLAFVVDRSRSVPDDRRALADRALEAAREHMPRAARAALIACAGDAVVEGALRPGEESPLGWRSALDAEATDLQAGIEAGLRAVGDEGPARVVLFSDGLETRGEALAAALRARQAGVPVDVVPLEWALQRDLRVEKVGLPAQVRPGEPFTARVVIRALRPAPALVRLLHEGRVLAEHAVELVAGTQAVALEAIVAEPGLARLEALVLPARAEDDQRWQNDRAFGFTLAPGERRVVHLAADPRDPAHEGLQAALLREGSLRLVTMTPAEAPLEAGGWEGTDAVLLHDLPAEDFSQAQLEALCAAVADLGVGLITIGGPDAYAAGEWTGTALEDALPVRLLPTDPALIPDTALVLVLDRSGSMDGEKLELAKAAAVATAGALSPQDQLGVVAFDQDAGWVTPLARGPQHAIPRVQALKSGGGTVMAPALRLALDGQRKATAAVKHVIVLTDGRSQGDPGELINLCAQLARARATTSLVSVGGDADLVLLRRMARAGGGKHWAVEKPRDLPRIFVREVQRVARGLVLHETFTPEARAQAPWLRGVGAPPALHGRVRLAEPKPRATVALVGPEGEPVLAEWQLGLGRVAAFASDTRAPWARDWAAWEDHGKLWTQLVRWVARDLSDAPVSVSASRQGDRARVIVEALDPAGEPIRDRVWLCRVRGPQGAPVEVALRAAGDGRWEGELEAAEAGVYTVSVRSRPERGGRERAEAVTGLAVPVAEELQAAAWDGERLRALAASAGGRELRLHDLIDGKLDLWDPSGLPERGASQALWVACLALAAGLFLLDVGVRRLDLDPGALFARGVPALAAAPSPPPASAPVPARPPALASEPAPASAREPGPASEPALESEDGLAARLRQAKDRARRRMGGAEP